MRWGLHEDEAQIAELLELNGMGRTLVSEERFVVAAAKPGGKVLAALRYRTQPKRLLLGLLVSDPWAQERPWRLPCTRGPGSWRGRLAPERSSPGACCTARTTPTKPGTAGDTRVGGIWTPR